MYGAIMILMRHGQSEFNLHYGATRRDPGIIDPKLTDLGHQQARDAARTLHGGGIERIIVSPYTRALQTAAPIAATLGVPVLINPIVRERYAFACDVGTARSQLQADWPHHDFSTIEEIWWPPVEEEEASIAARARLFRAEMAALPSWSNTLVISHWGFIRCMTGQRIGNAEMLRCDPTAPVPVGID